MFDGLFIGIIVIWFLGFDKGKAVNFWLIWKLLEFVSIDMFKFRILFILLFLCIGVLWRCLNFDVRVVVKVFRGFVEGFVLGLVDDVNLLTVCWVCWELVFFFGDFLDLFVECLNIIIIKIFFNYLILYCVGNFFIFYLSCWMVGYVIKNLYIFLLL